MFIVGELLTYVWSREGMHDALWLAYIATFIKQWGLTSATGFCGRWYRKSSRTAN